MLNLEERGRKRRLRRHPMKRVFDIVVALLLVVALGPLMGLIAVAIRLGSPGRAIFRQRRAGRGGKPFVMLKFRTMRTDVDPYGHSPHSAEDQRLTKLGRRLRETSLDELPQLFNVLAGQMSIVGPRPLYERQAARWDERQRRRLEVRPGITGYAQVYGRGELTHEDKIELMDWFPVTSLMTMMQKKDFLDAQYVYLTGLGAQLTEPNELTQAG